nr:ABC transporter permease subunit [Mesorhizobium sp.]
MRVGAEEDPSTISPLEHLWRSIPPAFWLGMILVVIFSTALGWLPGYGALSPGAITGSLDWLLDYLRHLALPVTAGALGLIGQYVVVARAAMSDIVTEDYMVPHGPKG